MKYYIFIAKSTYFEVFFQLKMLRPKTLFGWLDPWADPGLDSKLKEAIRLKMFSGFQVNAK